MKIWREFTFEAAHRLPRVPDGHKCGRLHGHSFRARIELEQPVDADTGWTMDFGDLERICRPTIDRLDHRYLNEIDGLENPTSENIASWMWTQLTPLLHGLSSITIQETCRNACTVSREP
ncbi:MAG: 6-carboxytetrahydropterin synthase QueD [bacterium]